MSLFSIICMCETRGANCAALKAFLGRLPSDRTTARIQPATVVPARDAARIAPSLSAGELGCYLSHVSALRAFLESEAEIGGTLEDDLHFDDETRALATLEAARLEISRGAAHIVNLDPDLQGASLHVSGEFVYSRFPGLNASFIMYSRIGAAAWLRALVRNAERDRYLLPVDNMYREAGVAYAVPVSTPFYQRREAEGAFASTIARDRRDAYRRRWQERLPDFVVHYAFRCHMLFVRNAMARTLQDIDPDTEERSGMRA